MPFLKMRKLTDIYKIIPIAVIAVIIVPKLYEYLVVYEYLVEKNEWNQLLSTLYENPILPVETTLSGPWRNLSAWCCLQGNCSEKNQAILAWIKKSDSKTIKKVTAVHPSI